MQSVIIAVLSALLFGGVSGFGVSYRMFSGEITSLNRDIEEQKRQAMIVLAAAENRIEEERETARKNKIDMEQAHEKNTKTIDALRHDIATARLSDPGRRPGGRNATPNGGGAGVSQGEAGSAGLSAELTRFLQIKFYAADKIAEYANQCYVFVVEQNCGIAK